MGLVSLARYKLGLGGQIRFKGIAVEQSSNQATYRVIEDIWMRGEYDVPGYIPQPGWRVIDVGANVGIFSILAASRGARVVACEPGPSAFARLRKNTAAWGVECHRVAVVGRPRESATLFLHPARDTRNTLFRPGGDFLPSRRVEVPALSISELLASPCDLLKVDCEGAEFEILIEGKQALRNAKRIIAEVDKGAGDIDVLVRELANVGFDVAVNEPAAGTQFSQVLAMRVSG